MFYPATVDDPSTRYTLPFFTNLELYKDARSPPETASTRW